MNESAGVSSAVRNRAAVRPSCGERDLTAVGMTRDGRERGSMQARAKSSRSADFEAVYQRHSREVWALVYARWLNADIAQDIMQETFLRLWKQNNDGGVIQNPRAWL